MVTRAYPEEFIKQTRDQNISTNKSVQENTPSNTPTTEYNQYYIPKEYWIILGIAVAGLVLALLLAVYELGKD